MLNAKSENLITRLGFLVIYYFLRLFGVLQLKYKKDHGGEKIVFCPVGYLTSVIHLLIILIIMYNRVILVPWQLTDLRMKIVFMLFVLHHTSGCCAVLTSFFYNRKLLLNNYEPFYKIYRELLKKSCVSSKSFIAFFIFHMCLFSTSIPFTITSSWIRVIREFLYVFVYTVPFAKELLITVLCYISEKIYDAINKELRNLGKMGYSISNLKNLDKIMTKLKEVETYTHHISHIFTVDILLIFIDFITRAIVHAYFVMDLKRMNYLNMYGTLVHASNVLLRLVFVAYRCQQVLNQTQKTSNELHFIYSNWLSTMQKDDTQKLRDVMAYSKQINLPQFSACGLFEVNLPFTVKVSGIMLTYAIVTLQAQ